MISDEKLHARVQEAVTHFWSVREAQRSKSGREGDGARSAVTGGAQMNGFVNLLAELLRDVGLPVDAIHTHRRIDLPGWYRPEKKWDLLVVYRSELIAALELKSHVGSFGNNFNNRTEEALGSATDLLAAYREGAFKPGARPWLGYLMLLEKSPRSLRPVRAAEPHFKVFPEFRGASYAKRYEILMTKLVRDQCYDAAAFLLSDPAAGETGEYEEPCEELRFSRLVASLTARVLATLQRAQ